MAVTEVSIANRALSRVGTNNVLTALLFYSIEFIPGVS